MRIFRSRIPVKWVRVLLFLLVVATICYYRNSTSEPHYKANPAELNGRIVDGKRIWSDGMFDIVDFLGEMSHVIIDDSNPPVGPGERGRGVYLSGREEVAGIEAKKKWFMNLVASDKISLDRTLKDQRHHDCQQIVYDEDLPSATVIIVFTDEAWSPLLRTVHSVFNRTPPKYLKQVVLVDDYSQREELHDRLEDYLKKFGAKLRLVRSKERLGLIRARSTGAKYSTGDVIIFIDAHCEATFGWIEPLLQRVKDAPNAFVCPVIDSIGDNDLAYNGGSAGGIGSFWWSLHYKMDNIPAKEKERRENPQVNYLQTPTMAGGLFAVRRDTFFHFGAYDEEMDIWGGENLEISFRAWMCGGSVEIIPCSHVGHIYRNGHPYNMTGRGGNKDVHGTNSKRLAEVWMDDYKKFYYLHRHELKDKFVGDLTARHELRQRLNCKSFKWFLDNVAYEKFIPDENVIGYGRVKNPSTGFCLDTLQRNEFKGSVLLGVYHCQYPSSSAQMFSLTKEGIFRRETVCADAPSQIDFPGKEDHLQLTECPFTGNGKIWELKNGQLRLTSTNTCLDTKDLKAGDDILLKPCEPNSESQQWIIENPNL